MRGFVTFVLSLFFSVSLSVFPLASFAKAGCCSKHGGVVGCNTASGFQKCKDGTDSPSCKCEGMNAPAKSSKKTTTKSSKSTTTTAAGAETATASSDVTKGKTAGCCSRHGGVAKCDTKSGYYMCKDGTRSSTCKCQ